jgi:serine phosphatase RsbU (regulator of sigma subunit)/anti-sigma regulatory factor (Ser/Thr protein kinase)
MMKNKPSIWKRIRRKPQVELEVENQAAVSADFQGEVKPLDIPANDPLLAYIQSSPGVIDLDQISLDSPTLEEMRTAGIRLALPLVSQGELIGLINLGPRRSEQDYSSDDMRLLQNLATQAAPALRVAQLVRQQQIEARQRERIEQELRVARVIQETLLPAEIPTFSGWEIHAHWQPAREVSGDFYDFIQLPDGRMVVIIADVTDKGVPAALVMATTRSILRGAVEHLTSPGAALARTNDLLHPDIPQKMFVTCLCLLIEPHSGKIVFANAGHNLPYLISNGQVTELRATGMPLGLMPGMQYEEVEAQLSECDSLLLSSDGLVEAHNPEREMYGFERMEAVMGAEITIDEVVPELLRTLKDFTGENYEQEDDITLVTLQHTESKAQLEAKPDWTLMAEFDIPSQPGNEREASEKTLKILEPINLNEAVHNRLQTAVAEATMNAMEHGNQYREDLPVRIKVMSNDAQIAIRVHDFGAGMSQVEMVPPDLESKLAGEQSPRGWGLFLIKNMVDEMNILQGEHGQIIELIVNRQAA